MCHKPPTVYGGWPKGQNAVLLNSPSTHFHYISILFISMLTTRLQSLASLPSISTEISLTPHVPISNDVTLSSVWSLGGIRWNDLWGMLNEIWVWRSNIVANKKSNDLDYHCGVKICRLHILPYLSFLPAFVFLCANHIGFRSHTVKLQGSFVNEIHTPDPHPLESSWHHFHQRPLSLCSLKRMSSSSEPNANTFTQETQQ